MTKRQKFLLTSGILSFGFLFIQLANILLRYEAILVLTLLSLGLSFWGLREGLSKNATLLALVLPVAFTLGIGLFYFLLPSTLLARLPVVALYAIGMYALLLTANIYTVAAIRTIALLRAAHAVGFLLTLAAAFFLFDTVLSLRLFPWWNSLLVFLVCLPLVLQNLWSVELEKTISSELLHLTLVISVVTGQLSFLLSFWPVSVAVGSLFLTSGLYVMLGLSSAKLQQRLFPRTVREYLLVGVVVFITMFLTTKWGG